MSHWFHRNQLKATAFVKFELKSVLSRESAAKICSELRICREQLLELLRNASSDLETIEAEFETYLGFFYGFIYEVCDESPYVEGQHATSDDFSLPFQNALNLNNNNKKSIRPKNSKLRYLESFSWTNSLLGTQALSAGDSWFEALNMCLNIALWYMKRAAWISAKDEVREYDAKNIHTALRKAAGIFEFVSDNTDQLSGFHDFVGNDMDSNVLNSYIYQCQAEAQEITIARAIELKHAPKLISALAAETANRYYACDRLLEKYPSEVFERWRTYFQLKYQFYLAYAYAYLGESLLAEDACGDAVRACTQGISCYVNAQNLCTKYAQSRGPGFLARPQEHLFFRRVEPMLNRHLEKAKRENDFIYHQKVPAECPLLTDSAKFGLANAIPFVYPKANEIWTSISYAAFDITKSVMPRDFGRIKKEAKKIPPVKEEKCYETDRDPTNHSGCLIS